MNLFKLVATLGLDTKEYTQGINTARSGMESLSVKAVAVGTAIERGLEKGIQVIGKLGSKAITASAEVQAETAQFKATFGELEAAANGAFEGIEKDTGTLSTRLRSVGTKAFSQFKGAGLDAASALGMMDKYTRLAADAAAYYDISLEDADARLRSFLRGNTEAGDAIGLFTSESQRNSKAVEIYGRKWLELTEAEKQMLMLNISDEIYNQSGAIGQAAREADGWANVTGNLKESWRQLLAVAGQPFSEQLTPTLQKLSEFFSDETVQMRVGIFFESLGKVTGYVFDGAISFFDSLIRLSNGEEGDFSDTATFLVDAGTFVSDHKDGILAISSTLFALWAVKHPFLALLTALGALVTNWKDVKQWTDEAKTAVQGFWKQNISDPISGVINGISNAFENLVDWVVDAQKKIDEFFGYNRPTTPVPLPPANYTPGGYPQGAGISNAGQSNTGYGKPWAMGSNATGLNYVPYNGFATRMHVGEAILNRREAEEWRSGAPAAIDYDRLSVSIASAVKMALAGVSVNIDGETAGRILAEPIGRRTYRETRNWRYSV